MQSSKIVTKSVTQDNDHIKSMDTLSDTIITILLVNIVGHDEAVLARCQATTDI